jgi:hypothetical protein
MSLWFRGKVYGYLAIILYNDQFLLIIIENKCMFSQKMSDNSLSIFHHKKNFSPAACIIPKIDNPVLQKIVSYYTPTLLTPKIMSDFVKEFGIYLYANDISWVENYFDKLQEGFKLHPEKKDSVSDFKLNSKASLNAGIIIGNGYVLSLLPEIPVQVIFLLDVEPAVHYFILCIRDLILSAEYEDFTVFKKELVQKISTIASKIDKNQELSHYHEIKDLGCKHFLANKERFELCRSTLLKKELIPININISNHQHMEKFSSLLKESNICISYLNVSNIADYILSEVLESNILLLPLMASCLTVTTSLIGKERDGHKPECGIGNIDELLLLFRYSWFYNTKPQVKASPP